MRSQALAAPSNPGDVWDDCFQASRLTGSLGRGSARPGGGNCDVRGCPSPRAALSISCPVLGGALLSGSDAWDPSPRGPHQETLWRGGQGASAGVAASWCGMRSLPCARAGRRMTPLGPVASLPEMQENGRGQSRPGQRPLSGPAARWGLTRAPHSAVPPASWTAPSLRTLKVPPRPAGAWTGQLCPAAPGPRRPVGLSGARLGPGLRLPVSSHSFPVTTACAELTGSWTLAAPWPAVLEAAASDLRWDAGPHGGVWAGFAGPAAP